MLEQDDLVGWVKYLFVKGVTNRDLDLLSVLKKVFWTNRDGPVLLLLHEPFLFLEEGVERLLGFLSLHIIQFLLSGGSAVHVVKLLERLDLIFIHFQLTDVDVPTLQVLLFLDPFALLQEVRDLEALPAGLLDLLEFPLEHALVLIVILVLALVRFGLRKAIGALMEHEGSRGSKGRAHGKPL